MFNKVGEVIEVSTSKFTAECYELHNPPPLGSLVKTIDGDVEIYGFVRNASTESIDPARRPIARGKDETSDENIYLEHPQLSRLLRTIFDTIIIGYGREGQVHHCLPPRPPRVHTFVHLCERDEVCRFTQSLDFLHTLLCIKDAAGDEVLAACLRQASSAHDDERAFMIRAGKELVVLLGGEFNRLNAILRRIRL